MNHLPRMRSFRAALLTAGLGVGVGVCLLTLTGFQQDAAPATQPTTMSDTDYKEAERGLKYRITADAPADRVAEDGDVLMVHYTGKLQDGTVFDTSRQIRQGQREPFPVPIMIRLGDGQVIPGWEIGLRGMKVGEKRELLIPSDLAYGDKGAGGVIPPGATLTFDVELIGLARNEE